MFELVEFGPVVLAWTTRLAQAPERLPTSDRARLEQLSPAGARRFLTGRALLDRVVRHVVGDEVDVTIEARCAACGSRLHGRPVAIVPGAEHAPGVSLGYAGALVVAAAVRAGAVGVDVERGDADAPVPGLAGLVSPAPPTLRRWTEIEAAVKADGRGLQIDPGDVLISPRATGWHEARVPGVSSGYRVAAAPAPEGYVISVAVS